MAWDQRESLYATGTISPELRRKVDEKVAYRRREWAMTWAIKAAGARGRSTVEALAIVFAENYDRAELIELMVKSGTPPEDVAEASKWAAAWIRGAV